MHALQIAHRDLKGANLLVTEQADRVATYLVDLDGVCQHRRLSPALRAANLARLAAGMEAHPWVTRSVWCRFLRSYISQFPHGSVDWKQLWRDVAHRSRRIIRRKGRRREQVL
jgi:tRNA A-37 threonylcarbamoyl transferase component Bud32